MVDDVVVDLRGLLDGTDRVGFEDVSVASAHCSDAALSSVGSVYCGLVWDNLAIRATGPRCVTANPTTGLGPAAGDNTGTTSGSNMGYNGARTPVMI